MKLSTDAKLAAGGVLVLMGAAWWLKTYGWPDALNPASSDNIVNRAFTSVYQDVTGSTGTLGGDLYDATHGGALDPTSTNNAVYSGVNGIGGAVTGDQNWTLGGWLYDVTH